jgi:hypothetical protein
MVPIWNNYFFIFFLPGDLAFSFSFLPVFSVLFYLKREGLGECNFPGTFLLFLCLNPYSSVSSLLSLTALSKGFLLIYFLGTFFVSILSLTKSHLTAKIKRILSRQAAESAEAGGQRNSA